MGSSGIRGFIKRIPKKMSLLRPEISLGTFLIVACMLTAIFVGLTIRLSGFRYGFYLSEFDSYWHLRSAEYIEDNGIGAF